MVHTRPFPVRYLLNPICIKEYCMMKSFLFRLLLPILTLLTVISIAPSQSTTAKADTGHAVYLPLLQKPIPPPEPNIEFRGLWVSRFDWTTFSGADPSKIDEVVDNMADAGFNAIFFQVRGEADAFYQSTHEPWSRRLTGTLGGDPGWDPLAVLVEKAHAKDIQVHAYVNVYPVWGGCTPPPSDTTPQHVYYTLQEAHGTTDGKSNGLQWDSSNEVSCAGYQRATPSSTVYDDHLIATLTELVTHYDVDGLHLDHIRTELGGTYDPVSIETHDSSYTYSDWLRKQVDDIVYRVYTEVVPLKESLWLSAAVWPIYIDYWGWGYSQGFHTYHQDSKSWLADGYIDSISPMLYPATFNCPDDSVWHQSRWQTLTTDFQADASGRYVIPGIATGYCDFSEIEARIQMARDAGTAGHALFSYRGLLNNGYFDDLANGPYAEPAIVPEITWRD